MSQAYAPARWPAASSTVLLWGLAAASVIFWGMRLSAPSDLIAPPAVTGGPIVAPDSVALSRLLGGVPIEATVPVVPEASSRFALLGVVADGDRQGAALIAVDGKAARPFRVGSKVGEGYVLQAVTTRAATLGASVDSAPAFTLQLPVRPMALPGAAAPR
ncbi:MAG: hypothetical protein EOP78_13725 [Variovorax sp.]|nr:MAG: hypothetical protein EOP78_13725 [Variovorax sp.]